MSQSDSATRIAKKTRIGTLQSLIEELAQLDPEVVKEDQLHIFFALFQKWDDVTYRTFLIAWGLPFARSTPKWLGGESSDATEPNTFGIQQYKKSILKILTSAIQQLETELTAASS